MTNLKPSLAQQRDLLQLQADLLRLKIAAEHIRNQRQAHTGADWQQLWKLAEQLPLGGLALKAVARPKRWQNKVLMGLAVAGLAWLRNRQD